MGTMQTSVPPAVTQAIGQYSQNMTSRAELAARAAEFEANVRMQEQQLQQRQTEAQMQNEQVKAQLQGEEEDRKLREKLAADSQQFEMRKIKFETKSKLAALAGLSAGADAQKDADAAALEQEDADNQKRLIVASLDQLRDLTPAAQAEALKMMEDPINAEYTSYQGLMKQAQEMASEVDQALFSEGKDQLDEKLAWGVESAAADSMTYGIQRTLNTVTGRRLFEPTPVSKLAADDPRNADALKVFAEQKVDEAVRSRIKLLSEKFAPLVSDKGQEAAAAGALEQIGFYAQSMAATKSIEGLSNESKVAMVEGFKEPMQKAIENAAKLGITLTEVHAFLKGASVQYKESKAKIGEAALADSAQGKSPAKAVNELQNRLYGRLAGLEDSLGVAGFVDPEKKLKDDLYVAQQVAREFTGEKDQTAFMAEASQMLLGTLAKDVLPKLSALRVQRGFDERANLKQRAEAEQARSFEASKKGTKAKRRIESAQTDAVSEALRRAAEEF